MSMFKLAFLNFKSGLKNYMALILSLAFTVLILFNFQNLLDSDALGILGEINKRNIDIIIEVITFVIVCFMLFFIWYATNVFLTQRKKEIGIYVFMGLTNQRIGRLYMIETTMTGMVALAAGLGLGILTSKLFQMVLLAVSHITGRVSFKITVRAVFMTILYFGVIYMLMVVKGYISIVRSSVLELVSASRKNEYVRQSSVLLIMKAVLGVAVLGTGYYLAVKEAGMEVMGNALMAVVFVTIGTYFLFGGLIPVIFQALEKNKPFLFKKERNLWINNIIFRIRKNYRTYAMVTVLMICSVTVLATAFAMKERYDAMIHFRETYDYQIMSNMDGRDSEFSQLIEQKNDIRYKGILEVLPLSPEDVDSPYQNQNYALIARSALEKMAQTGGFDFDIPPLEDDQIFTITKLYLMSLAEKPDYTTETETILGKVYKEIGSTNRSYLGRMQEEIKFYVVSDKTYERVRASGTPLYLYNYKLMAPENAAASLSDLDTIVSETQKNTTAYVYVDPASNDIVWVKMTYAICIFLFMVFVVASASILFMKVYNDAYEDQARFGVLKKLGISRKTLRRSVICEMRFAYGVPFVVMAVSSWFAVNALANVMMTTLYTINLISALCIFAVLYVCYRISIEAYVKNAQV